ncbi:MAG: periplasmic heavy metal sensor [Myxococcales bacterium]|nr:periplasmic heavy metal sensor [Myxococcales bacterium]
MKRAILMAVSVLMVLSAAAALAGPPPAAIRQFAREIGLSDDQIRKLDELHYTAEKEKVDIRAELDKARLELRHLMSQDKPNEAAVFGMVERIGAIRVRMQKNRVGLMLKVKALMTPAQWEKLESFIGDRFRERREMRQKMRGMGPGMGRPGAPMPPAPPAPPGR